MVLTNGVGPGTTTWLAPTPFDVVDADDGAGLTGESDSVFVVQECVAGPTAAIDFGTEPEAVACWDDLSGLATVSGSMLGSAAGFGGPIVAYALAIVGGPSVSDVTPTLVLEVQEVGSFAAEALVVDPDGCGDVVETRVSVGLDDGEPVGSVILAPDEGELDVLVDSTTVRVSGVTDCTGDLAVGGTLYLRTDRGEILGATASGDGLAVTLGMFGDAAVVLDATTTDTGGLATLVPSVPAGTVSGVATVSFAGDSRRPNIWEQTPRGGDVTGEVSEIRVRFSEEMRDLDLVPSLFTLTGPGPSVVETVTKDALDPRVVSLALDLPADADAGLWTLTASQELRDQSGNRLEGAWDGAEAPWVGAFGGTALVSPVDDCVQNRPTFAPDGDDGSGAQADSVTVDFESATAPAWWVLTVENEDAFRVRVEFSVPVGAADQVTWDGRDVTGKVVADGTYTLIVDSDDGLGNRGGSCERTVTVDNEGS